MFKKSFTLIILLVSFTAYTQEMKMTKVEPTMVTARVVGVLEGNSNLAVLYVTKVDTSNKYNLEGNTEILTRFHFGTIATKGDPALPGVKSGDMISAEIIGKLDKTSAQMDYTVLRYELLEVITIEKTSTEVNDSPRK